MSRPKNKSWVFTEIVNAIKANEVYLYIDIYDREHRKRREEVVELPTVIGNLKNLAFLHVSCGLKYLPSEIGELKAMHSLIASSNKLTVLPDTLWGLINLQRLELYRNRLATIPSEIGQLVNLKEIDLSYNPITKLPPEIQNLTKLWKLNLEGTKLPIPQEILYLHNKPKVVLDYYFSVINQRRRNLNEIELAAQFF